jgi:predicted MPP superfamily phosphohydrolase
MLLARRNLQPILAAGGILGAWGLFEAQWVEFKTAEVPLERLPAELDGFTILHLSDLHLGTFSLNGLAFERAVAWAERTPADLVVLTGDLLSRRRGERRLRNALARLRAKHGVFAVFGNHDVPASRRVLGTRLLEDSSVVLDVSGRRVQLVGASPRPDWKTARIERLADPEADLRVLLFHYPDVTQWLPAESYDVVLAGHLHGGQICLPLPSGEKLRLEHLRAPHWEGLHRTGSGTLHVSRGLGTSFVPFRLLARPEATKLVLRCHTGSTL